MRLYLWNGRKMPGHLGALRKLAKEGTREKSAQRFSESATNCRQGQEMRLTDVFVTRGHAE